MFFLCCMIASGGLGRECLGISGKTRSVRRDSAPGYVAGWGLENEIMPYFVHISPNRVQYRNCHCFIAFCHTRLRGPLIAIPGQKAGSGFSETYPRPIFVWS